MCVLAAIVLAGVLPGRVPLMEAPKLQCRIEVASTTRVGEPVLLRFVLRNLSTRRVFLLKWDTPLEGLRGPILSVMAERSELPYLGLQLKRGDPARSEYLALAPGDSAAAEVDLAKSYDLSLPGRYAVRSSSRIVDFSWNERSLPRPRDGHRGIPLSCEPDSQSFVRVS